MEKIEFDSGVKSYRINKNQILRFNPCDPNVYARFLQAADEISQLEKSLTQQAQQLNNDGAQAVKLLSQADAQMKKILSWVFGEENDFDAIVGGVNLLAVAENGQRVVTNLFEALTPLLTQGMQRCAQEKANEARDKAAARRKAQC